MAYDSATIEPRTNAPAFPGERVWDSEHAVARIAAVLPPIERAYATVRFGIIRTKFLALMDLALPAEGRVLDVGCGFGLFSVYFALMGPRRQIRGIDPNPRRVEIARQVAAALGVSDRVQYEVGNAEQLPFGAPYDAIYMLDVLHHVARAEQEPLLHRLRQLVAPAGTLLLKDITTDSIVKLKFTELLDRVMVGWKEPLSYRHHGEWSRLLEQLGFSVHTVRVPDVLPYPHVVMVARRT
jgi:2-polyprenyl-3-methyl-5-hydroxy-6-metoxy-1,4-benzoquinol methylase